MAMDVESVSLPNSQSMSVESVSLQQSMIVHLRVERSSYGLPKTSSPSAMHHSQSLSSLASLNSLVAAPHQSKPSNKPASTPQPSKKPSSSSSSSKGKERELALLRGDLMLAQAAAHGAYHAAVAAAAKGKNMSPLYPFGMPGADKDGRHAGIDSLTGLPHTILSAALEGGDPSSVLGGVRLPPDTEIIKYTSSLAGPKAGAGTTTRGRKKTISLDPPHVSVHPADRNAPLPSKRPKLDEYGNSRSSVEVIRLPTKPDRAGHNSLSGTPPPNLSDYAGISRELLQTIASQSGVSLAALERQLAGSAEAGLNLSTKMGDDSPLDLGVKSSVVDEDAPLNLSLKPTPASSQASDALSRLTSLSSSLNASSSHDRISRRKPGAKPRRVAPELNPVPDAPRPKSSGSEDTVAGWAGREGRPRNLGRGVSKPKKNTVASLLAQSRALGLRPALAHQLLAETDLEKLKALLGETASTDSECPSDSCPSDSDASDTSRRPNDAQLRLPLALGWKRVTVIKGLSRNCSIKGDVTYSPPDPHAGITMRSLHDIQNFLESNPCPPLSTDNFSFSARTVLGELEEARLLSGAGGRPTPPPLDRRMELARLQQAARDARRDASNRSRDQARLERSEKAELAKREKEARSQQLLEHINKNRTQLTIEPLPTVTKTMDEWKIPEIVMGPATKTSKERIIPPISLSLIPVTGPKDQNSPIKTLKFDQSGWKEEYNALDKMKDFAEKAAFDLPKRKDKNYDFTLVKSAEKRLKAPETTNNLEKLIESYSRITEFINGCDWSQIQGDKKTEDPKAIEQKYLNAKNEFMSQNLMLMPKESPKSVLKEVIDLSEDDDILTDIMAKKINKGTFSVGKDGALSISVHPLSKETMTSAKRRKHEEIEKQKIEEQAKRQQEREIKRQQAILLKEQERERRRQHTSFIRQLDSRRRWEERERRKHQNLLDRLLVKERKLQQRRREMELLSELRHGHHADPEHPADGHPGRLHRGVRGGVHPSCVATTHRCQDPGVPHPGRHTTLLGHAIRMSEVTHQNFSEILRIYLYANATGEVKALTGLTAERERERRVADHHQTEAEMLHTCANSKNSAYYEHLHNNPTYKLSEELRDKSYAALSASTKARIFAYICDELLQNKKVLSRIDSSLEHLTQLRKERYLMDMKIRKTNTPPLHDDENQQTSEKEETPKKDKESSPHPESETDKQSEPSPYKDPPPTEESDKELSPLKDLSNSMKNKEIMNNNKDECSPADNSKMDKDSMIGDCDANLSDLESEGTQPEEDEDKNLSSEELARKLDKLVKQSEQQQLQLAAASHALRATCYGQDRYWRRYWSLGQCGGIFVEGMESAQPEIMAYHQQLETHALSGNQTDGNKKKKKGAREKKESPSSDSEKRDPETEAQKKEEALKSEMELKSIKSELNLSDHTQIIKYEPNVKHGACKVEGSSIKMEEKYIQQKNNDEQDMLDIEDSIPTAFLVQKPTHKPMFAAQAEQMDKPQEIVKVENVVKNENESENTEESKDSLVNNLEELRKMAEAVSIQLDAAKKEQEIKEEKEKVKKETHDPSTAHIQLYSKMLDGKWFSILRHESSFLNNINDEKQDLPEFCDNEHTCSEIILCQGHKWDVSNNLHLLNDPSLFTLNSMVTSVQVPSNNIYADSSLTMSGLDQDVIDNSFNKDGSDNDLEKELQADALKQDLLTQKAKANSLNSLGLLNFNALSTYVTCDSPPPIQMSAEELDQLEYCKVHGLPKKIEGNYPYIDKGDLTATELTLSHLDRVIALNGGIATDTDFSPIIQRRIDTQLLNMVEELEERVAAASMQVKGWRPGRAGSDGAPTEPVPRAKHKLQALEAHIERRYLKPPFVQSTTEATIGAVLQAEHGNTSAPSPQNTDGASEGKVDNKGIARGLANWREALSRCTTSSQLAMMLQALEAAIAWDKSIMKANCQFCQSGDNEDQLLLYCWECINKARGQRVCIVCGGAMSAARTIPCALCARAYHQDCHYPPLLKNPRGKWYCSQCISKAPPKKPRNTKKRDAKHRDLNTSLDIDQNMVPSPAASHASTSTTAEECSGSALHTPEKHDDKLDDTLQDNENGINHTGELSSEEGPPEKRRAVHYVGGNGALQHDETDGHIDGMNLLCEMECHEHAWPFLLPVNTKQFPQYKKVIKCPMDLSTIKKKLQDNTYKCKEEFASDVRLMFSNCEVFNEDDSPVGRAGHNMRQFFDDRWAQI
ncbi:hypothetical protein SFRURICE_019198 [Spodoptera frugiperda]|nr:hypothetical protein SFRURICE_019198 [Spodoptera frugiperda]